MTKLATMETAQSVSGFALREGEVYVVRTGESTPEIREALVNEGIHHLLLVPVEGKHSRGDVCSGHAALPRIYRYGKRSF